MPSFTNFGKILLAATFFFLPGTRARGQSTDRDLAQKKTITDLKEVAYAGDMNAQVELGVIYLTGNGVPRDDAEAVKWLRKAADQDSPLGERYLAEMYFKGRGVAADNEEAAKWLRLAANQDDAQSQYNLAVLYTKGLGVPRNLKEATNLMRRAAAQHLAAGEFGLGAAYENGDDMPQDPVEAVKWYQKAVDQNYVPAMNTMALLLATSTNAKVRNTKQAIAMAAKAVAGGANPDYLDTLAQAYFADGQTDSAIETEQRALARDPENETYKQSLEKFLAAAHANH
jgi:TPR repeat protein